MKPASAIFQAVALIACLSANLQTAGIHMPGMRRAIQAIAETAGEKAAMPLPIGAGGR